MHAETRLEKRYRVARGCAIGAAVMLASLATFEVALAAGVPWGKAAWGGGQAELVVGYRVASGVGAVVFVGFALVVLRRAGHRVWAPLPQRWLPASVWVVTAYMAVGTLLNLISRSPVERAVMSPTALGLAVLCGIVAVAARTPGAPRTPRTPARAT
jgi:hypothetical protein